MAELRTWCRIFAVGLPCAKPCDSCRATSRRAALLGPGGGVIRAAAPGGGSRQDAPDGEADP